MHRFPRSIAVLAFDQMHEAAGEAAAILEQGINSDDLVFVGKLRSVAEAWETITLAVGIDAARTRLDKQNGISEA